MNKYLLAMAVALTFALTADSNEAEARGFHFSSGGVHVDVGRPHSYRGTSHHTGYHGSNVVVSNRGYSPVRNVQVYHGGGHYGGGHGSNHYGGHSTWHNTSHLDYHRPEIVRHGNHLDYVPGHYDVHNTGHWDHH